MKNLLLIILFPISLLSQSLHSEALNFQNNIRSYYDLSPLEYDEDLSNEAQKWAEHLALTDDFEVSDDNYGENIYALELEYYFSKAHNIYLEASINWVLDSEDELTLNQIKFHKAKLVGFGKAQSKRYIYVVAKYDKLSE